MAESSCHHKQFERVGSFPHPILKREGSKYEHDQDHHIHFDEKVIEEQMQERIDNPKMKIDEPDTPYHRGVEGDAEEECDTGSGPSHQEHTDSEMHARLVMAASALEPHGSLSRNHSSEFEAKRRAVYADEGRKFKELSLTMEQLDDEDSSAP